MLEVSNIKIGSYICLSRLSLGSEETEGIVISCNGNFVYIKDYSDFVFGGYHLISSRDINGIFRPSQSKKIEEVCVGEGWCDIADEALFLKSVQSWRDVAKALFDKGVDAQFEVNSDEIHLGRIISVKKDGFDIIAINRDFTHDKKPFFLQHEEIVGVRIMSPYLSVFSKYSS